jgi:hypothetical protein
MAGLVPAIRAPAYLPCVTAGFGPATHEFAPFRTENPELQLPKQHFL